MTSCSHADPCTITEAPATTVMRFRNFVIVPEARLLLHNGHALEVGSRAFDLFVILVRCQGQIVAKQTIIDFVWPTTVVEESNLRFQMAVLRKLLGRDRNVVKTIPGRGYLLAAEGHLGGQFSVPEVQSDAQYQREGTRLGPPA